MLVFQVVFEIILYVLASVYVHGYVNCNNVRAGYSSTTIWYHGRVRTRVRTHDVRNLKNDLKYKHSGATGTLVGVVSIGVRTRVPLW